MNYADTWAEDEDGKRFIFTVEMKRKLAKAGLPIEPSSLKELGLQSEYQARAEPVTRESSSKPVREVNEPEMIQIDPETGKYIGTLKWYNSSRGYGFISRGGGEDIFFHKTSTVGDPLELQEGQWVLYDVEERSKGPEATEVEPYTEKTAEPPETD
jgi:CspA family cold shock protein